MAYAFPLKWPDGRPRTKYRKQSQFKVPTSKAFEHLRDEVGRMLGTSHLVISTDIPLRADALPRMDREPMDSGVAIYFQRDGNSVVFACDQYDSVKENAQAIAKTIEALRGIERWGSADMMERAFRGFAALPEPERVTPWNEVLGFNKLQIPALDSDMIEMRFKKLAGERHPDKGGSDAAMQELNRARREGLEMLVASL